MSFRSFEAEALHVASQAEDYVREALHVAHDGGPIAEVALFLQYAQVHATLAVAYSQIGKDPE